MVQLRKVKALAATAPSGHFSPYSFNLREIGPDDMVMRVMYCGIDHTDLHQARGELQSSNTTYPLVPGYEMFLRIELNNASSCSTPPAYAYANADAFLLSTNEVEMKKAANSLDYILDTVPAYHPLQLYLSLLKVEGKMLIVGAPPQPLQFSSTDMILGKKTIAGSFIGSVEETQELLNFWVEKGLTTMIEVVKADYVNQAFERMERNDVRYKFVLDVAGSNLG